MKNFATGTALDMSGIPRVDRREPIPFFGFVTGIVLSTALWLDIAAAVWIVGR